ncbi:MAG: hypothetical protein CBHOC_5246 [uncultured Caballeronia sp.]|nr:MAG: hypothetical protein CBHOC_5246 [uncultured Caballeronia sp.]
MKDKNAHEEEPLDEASLGAVRDALAEFVDVICRRTPRALSVFIASPIHGSWRAIAACGQSEPRIVSGQNLDQTEYSWARGHEPPTSKSKKARLAEALRLCEPIMLHDGGFFGNLCFVASPANATANASLRGSVAAFADMAALLVGEVQTRGNAEIKLAEATAAADERERFMAVLAHDLRSPLGTVQAIGQAVSVAPDRANLPAIAKTLLAAAARMSTLIGDVLDLARARLGGGIPMRWQGCAELADQFAQIVEEARAVHPNQPIISDIQIARTIDCDPMRLQQLFQNLLDNAFSHGAPGQPIAVVARISGAELELRVANEGAEIDPAMSARLFEPFWRAKGKLRPEGLGLGLFICQHIAGQHGGQIRVESAAGTTTFVLTMPVSRA